MARLRAPRRTRIGLALYLAVSLIASSLYLPTSTATGQSSLGGDVGSAHAAERPTLSPPALAVATLPAATVDAYWTIEPVDDGAGVGGFSSLAIDASDHLHVSYYDAPGQALRYATHDGATWVITTVDSSRSVGLYTSLDLDNSQYPHISYSVSGGGLRHAYRSGLAWASEAVDSDGQVGEYNSLGVGRTYNDVLISYYDATNQRLKFARLYNHSWITSVVDAGPGVGLHTALDATRYAHIAYLDASSGRLEYIEDTFTGWDASKSPVNKAGDGGEYLSLAIDSRFVPHISYFSDSRDEVVHTYYDSDRWYKQVLDTVAGEATAHTSIAVDQNDHVHIAYSDDIGSGNLFYGYGDGSTWVTETIASGGVEGYPSIAIDSDGYPHITYQTSTGLKHAWLRATSDLIVTDVWDDGGQIWYQVRNVGQGTAPAGHQVALRIDSVSSGTSTVSTDLAPGARHDGVFTTWTCSGITDTLQVTADSGGTVVEADETNNVREEVWTCDTVAPQFTWGPTATLVTAESAVIAWGTNESSDSRVDYDQQAGQYGSSKSAGASVTSHQVTLTGLSPASVYRYVAASTDPSGNTLTSGELFFETAALPSSPVSGTIAIARGSGDYPVYQISALIDSPTSLAGATPQDLDYVAFYMDDLLVGVDHTSTYLENTRQRRYEVFLSPSRLGLARDDFFVDPGDQLHRMEARVFSMARTGTTLLDLYGPPRESMPVDLTFLTPAPDHTLYYETGGLPNPSFVDIFVEAIEYEWECEWVSFRGSNPYAMAPDCGDVAQAVPKVDLYVNGEWYGDSTSPVGYVHQLLWNATGKYAGDYEIRVVAQASDGSEHEATQMMHVEHGTPSINVTREVTQNETSARVRLTIENHADAIATAYVDKLIDWTRDFQPVHRTTTYYTVSSVWQGIEDRGHRVAIDMTGLYALDPGEAYTIEYDVVPVLYDDGLADPSIGDKPLTVHYSDIHQSYVKDYPRPFDAQAAHAGLTGAADYILVTNPSRVFLNSNEENGNILFSDMAHLAHLKQGVLGYLSVYEDSEHTLDELIEPGGYWVDSLAPKFQDIRGGYVLIVGEIEIVPAWNRSGFDVCWSKDHWYEGCDSEPSSVSYHDHYYANTEGSGAPDLVVSRVIGNNAVDLRHALETSIGVHEGWEDHYFENPGEGLLVSGRGESVTDFRDNVDEIYHNSFPNAWDRTKIHWQDYDEATYLHVFTTSVKYKEMVYFSGHGNVDGWSPGLGTGNFPLEFGGYRPFVFAPSCLTGNYETGDDQNIAEAFFASGASVYIGATQVSPIDTNIEAGKWFFDHWNFDDGESFCHNLTQLERAYWDEDWWYDWWEFWIYEYNCYGDAKFGTAPYNVQPMAVAPAAYVPTTTLHVQVPGYVVTTTVDGFHQVSIPGGMQILESGLPEIPYWSLTLDYPQGYRVQDVVLTARSGLSVATGLDIPTNSITYYISSASVVGANIGTSAQRAVHAAGEEWFPAADEIYRWTTTRNPDGSTELDLRIYPFSYNALSARAEFYSDYDFDIDLITTTVLVDRLSLDRSAYPQGNPVTADLWVSNSGAPQDVIVVATVQDASGKNIVDGLPLQVLHDLAGPAMLSLQWDSSGIPAGDYVLAVELVDSEGNWLDRAREEFGLGVASGEVAALTATPGLFQPGDPVNISLVFSNTGTMPITGTAMIQVQTADGVTVAETFAHAVSNLAPGAAITLPSAWDTTGATEERYRILAYIQFGAKTSGVKVVEVSTRDYVYLPLVLRSGP